MIRLLIEAPFAACRPMTAGWYRPTAGFLTHSAAYGLILNVAGVESRLGEHEPGHPGRVPATVTRAGLPAFRLALGLPEGAELPRVGSLFQQLHSYPISKDNASIKPEHALGRKNHIAPVRREVLCDLRVAAVVQADGDFEALVRRGLGGGCNEARYGVPFLGDNNLTLDRIEEVEAAPARWFALADAGRGERPRSGTSRLTAYVDRVATIGTRSALFSPQEGPSIEPPEPALVPVGDPAAFDEWAARQLPA